ncbi:MAG: outer membrane lipoprotein-sorting protein [Deltaproteobacteria bacterium]|nr:outer membrane lipoprotein-sorting protein [Deltaproteobacteria bacterium]
MSRPTLRLVCAATALSLLLGGTAHAISAHDVMQQSQAIQEKPQTRRGNMTMTLVDKSGDKRVRKVTTYTKKYGPDSKSVLFFLEPADVKGTGFLQFGYKAADQDDDQWLYLPALKRTRKITSSNKNQSFMGTDFSYDDMATRDVDDDEHKLLREDTVGDQAVWVIESTPKKLEEDDEYSKAVSYIRKSDYLPAKAEFYDRKGALEKTLMVQAVTVVDGIPTPAKLEMTSADSGHKTLLEMDGLEFDKPLDDELFTQRMLEKGP